MFYKVLWGSMVMKRNLRNAEVRPLVLKGKWSSQSLWRVSNPKGEHSIARHDG